MRYMYYVTSDLNVVFVSETPPQDDKQVLKEARSWLKQEMDNVITTRENVVQVTNRDQITNMWKKAIPWGGRKNEEHFTGGFFDIIQEENAKEILKVPKPLKKETLQKVSELQKEILRLLEEDE